MDALLDLLSYDFLRHALLAGLAASVLCGVVGTLMVVKRLVFLGAGLSHAAFGGLGICYWLGVEPLWGGGAVAVGTALLLGGDDQRRPPDATVGILWAVGMAAGIVFVGLTPGYAPNLMTYLFGNVLAVRGGDVLLLALLAAVVLAALGLWYKEITAVAFDEEFAAVQGVRTGVVTTVLLIVTALSVVFLIQLVGIILVIALLTIPPVTALYLFRGFRAVVAASTLIGAGMTVGGLALSYVFDLPSGPAMVLLGAAGLVVVAGAKGAWRRLRHAPALPLLLVLLPALAPAVAGAEAAAPVLTADAPVELSLAAGEVRAVSLEIGAGERVRLEIEQRGIDVRETAVDPSGNAAGDFDSPTGADGVDEVEITAGGDQGGLWRLEIRPLDEDAEPGSVLVRLTERLSAEEVAAREAARRARRQATVDWVANHAVPLETARAGHGFSDLEPLRRAVGDARVVGLGEATHGTREFFQLKHRVLEFLVAEMGFTAFAIEATMPEAFDVDRYVVHGEGDPRKALSALYFWTWDTEEVLALIEWMRAWNADPAHRRKVRFYGFDMQSAPRAARVVRDHLGRDDPAVLTPEIADALAYLMDPSLASRLRHADPERQEAVRAAVTALPELLERADPVVRRHARVLEQNVEMHLTPGRERNVRDESMAENVRWILDREGPDGKVVLWAHNGHLAAHNPWFMGHPLRQALGDDYVAFGFSFGQGSFQARGFNELWGHGLRTFNAPLAAPGSFDRLFHDAAEQAGGLDLAFLDLGQLPETGPVAEWFAEPRPVRSIGAVYDEVDDRWYAPTPLPEAFDGMFYVDDTRVARANPWVFRGPEPRWPEPLNGGFELDLPGLGEPIAWTLRERIHLDVEAVVRRHDDCPQGVQCLELRRRPGRRYGESAGGVEQRVDPAAFHGRTVRLGVLARYRGDDPDARAHLTLTAEQPPTSLFAVNPRHRERVTGDGWSRYEMAIQVPDGATAVTVRASLLGGGSLWLDDVRLELVGETDGDEM